MEQRTSNTKPERLFERYWGIADLHRNGLRLPILWHLAFRRHPDALLVLSQEIEQEGRISRNFSRQGLAYRSFRLGEAAAAQNLAMDSFNRGDLQRYRFWLWKAARLGDEDSARELKRFEVRLPHDDAARIGRKRPYHKADFR